MVTNELNQAFFAVLTAEQVKALQNAFKALIGGSERDKQDAEMIGQILRQL